MKNYITVLILIGIFSATKAQNDSNRRFNTIDPARFVKVYDQRMKSGDAMLIAEFPGRQYNNFVDEKSKLFISFDVDQIVRDSAFYGSLSLKAKINGREVEVDGYNEIGEREKSYGLSDAFSSYFFSSTLLGMLKQAEECSLIESTIDTVDLGELVERRKTMLKLKAYREQTVILNDWTIQFLNYYRSRLEDKKSDFIYKEFIREYVGGFFSCDTCSVQYLENFVPHQFRSLKNLGDQSRTSALNIIKKIVDDSEKKENEINAVINNKVSMKQNIFKTFDFDGNIKRIRNVIPIFQEYVNYFVFVDPNALQSLSMSLNRDPVFISHIVSALNSEMKKTSEIETELRQLVKDIEDNTVEIDVFINKIELVSRKLAGNIENYNKVIENLKTLNQTFVFEEYVKASTPKNSTLPVTIAPENYAEVKTNMFVDEKFMQFLTRAIAQKVGGIAFNELTDGILDLDLLDAKEGDKVQVYVVWYKSKWRLKSDGTFDTIRKAVVHPILSVHVKKLNWKLKVEDSFFLVNRFNEDENSSNLSPSKFKGAPGGSLLIAYGNDKRQSVTYKSVNKESHRAMPTNKLSCLKFFKALEPSFGINVSYLDFDTKKDFEVGAGLTMGLFRGSILFTYGYNLSVRTQPCYVGLGFSFGQVYQNLKNGYNFREN